MAKIAGSTWVDANSFHYVDKNGQEWFFTGSLVASRPGAIVGSVWVNAGAIHYIDGTGTERQIASIFVTSRLGVGALSGSMWVEPTVNANYSYTLIDNNANRDQRQSHSDVAHTDTTINHTDTHTDTIHSDSHSDSHGDSYTNSHGDVAYVAHSDGGSPGHGDVPHHDYHLDGFYDAPDRSYSNYQDHEDAPGVSFSGNGHGDSGGRHDDQTPQPMATGGNQDNHQDWHADGSHSDSPGTGHTDTHGDGHSDSHGDVAHADVAHQDVAHQDVAFFHSDTHTDQPTFVG